MRLFGGFSTKIGRRVRAGVSASGRPWVGARARGPAGLYAGAIASTGGRDAARPPREAVGPARLSLHFDVDDDGTVTLNGGRVNVEQLRSVVQLSDELRTRHERGGP